MLRRPAAGTICRRGLSALARAAVALLLVTCTDDPIGPGHGGIASLRLQPVFDAFSRNAGLPLDQVRVIVIRPPSDTLANVNQHFDPTSQQLRLNIPVRLERSTESLELHLEMYSGSILLFTGMDFVTVTAGTTNPAAPITMTYQGPGTNVGSVTLTPRDTTVLFGGSFDFQASAVDSQQQPVVQFYVGWTASAGTVDGNGRFTAPNAVDTVLVTATTPTGITDATRVFVIAPPAALVKSGGDQQSAPAGSRLPLPLEVRVDDASGQPVPGIAVAFAVVTGGGSVDSAAATTDARGIARTGATLGSAVGVQSFTATVSGVAPVTFTATATTFSPLGRPLAAGEDHTCEIRGGQAYCWGSNSNGELGDGTTTDRYVPIAVTGGLQFAAITAGNHNTCALTTAGQAYCWGRNNGGQLGDGTTTDRAAPTPVQSGLSFVEITAGFFHACARTATGEVYCWGANSNGQLGNGTTTPSTTPVLVSGGLTFTAVSIFGDNHTCGLVGTQGYCWGYNFDGGIGDGTTSNRPVPTPVSGGQAFVTIHGGYYHSCGLSTTGQAFCWGDNNVGQIGDGGAPSDRHSPVAVSGGITFTQLSVGGPGGCGLASGGSAYCWGLNSSGQLGNGTTTGTQTPVAVSGGLVFSHIAQGDGHVCGLTAGGTYCWGSNSRGKLGVGATTNNLVPVQVLPPAGPPATISANSPTIQTASVGTLVATAPAVIVRDAQNNPVPGVDVGFAVTAGGGSIAPSGNVLTNAAGIAALASWTLGPTAGANAVTATLGGAAGSPVTFNATATSPGATRTWTGTLSSNWAAAGNWNPSGVPTATDDVVIPAGTPSAPVSSANAAVRNLTVAAGASLSVPGGTMTLTGNLDASGLITVDPLAAALFLDGTGKTVSGYVSDLSIRGTYSGDHRVFAVSNDLIIRGRFTLNGTGGVSIGGDLVLLSAGQLEMQDPVDYVRVQGNAFFTGGSTAGLMTEGVLDLWRNLTQNNSGTGNPSNSFSPSGNHITRFSGNGTQAVDIFNSGLGSGLSHFANLQFGTTLPDTVNFTRFNTVFVEGQLMSDPQATPGLLTSSNSAQLSVGGADVNGLGVGLPLTIAGGTITRFDNVTFDGIPGTATQLTVDHPGAGGPLTFDHLTFTNAPTTGLYLRANDTDGASPDVLTIGLTNPNPSTPSGFVQAVNGAVISWPGAAPAVSWNGSVSTDWNDPANWTPASVPISTTDVTVPFVATSNYPVLTTNADVRDLTILNGATLGVQGGLFKVYGSLIADGPIPVTGSGVVQLSGKGKSVLGSVDVLTVQDTATYALAGPLSTTDLTIRGQLLVGGLTVSVQNNLSVFNNGLLVMQTPSDSVFVGNQADFSGGSTAGLLTDGILVIQGNFFQRNTNSAESFSASGNHRTRLTGSNFQQVDFQSSGTGPGTSHFHNLGLSQHTSGGVTFVRGTVVVEGQLNVAPVSGQVQLFGSNSAQLAVTSINAHDLVLNDLPLAINGGTITQFDRVTFGGFQGDETQLTLNHPGRSVPYYFDGLTFQDPLTTGHHLLANDTDNPSADTLRIGLLNPTPASPATGGFVTQNGAVVTWPAAFPGLIWTGAFGTDWSNPLNWSPVRAPDATTPVTIDSSAAFQPSLSANSLSASLTVLSGAQLDMSNFTLQVGGNVSIDGLISGITGSKLIMTGSNGILQGPGAIVSDIQVTSPTRIGVAISVIGALSIDGGSLDLNGSGLAIGGNLVVANGGLLIMQDPNDVVSVSGNATFDGGNELTACPGGCMSSGTLQISGNLTQLASSSGDSFHPSGTHFTIFAGSTPTLSFATPGDTPGTSHFEGLMWSGSGTMTLASDVWAHGNLQIGSAGGIVSANRVLTAGDYFTGNVGLVLNNTRLEFRAAGTSGLPIHDLTFVNMDPAAVQLTVRHPGFGLPIAFTNLTFSTQPTTGFYLWAEDTDGAANGFLSIDMVNPSPATADGPLAAGQYKHTVGGATINW